MNRARKFVTAAVAACLFPVLVSAEPPKGGPPAGDLPPTTSDAMMIDVTRRLAGFGGVFLDAEGRINVYILGGEGPGTEEEIGRRHQRILGALGGVYGDALLREPGAEEGRMRELRVLDGYFEIRQLAGWRDKLRERVLEVEGVVSLDLDERENRVSIGVVSEGVAKELGEIVSEIAMPKQAVRIEVVEPYVYMKSVKDKFRPMIGGIQLETDTGWFEYSNCTMGFNATFLGEKGFVTNSHCSGKSGEKDDIAFHQPEDPWWTEKNKVGREMWDPPYFTGGNCPEGGKCRISDSNFVRYKSDKTFGGPHIAQGKQKHGRKTVGEPYTIVALSSFPVAGFELDKIGRRTGWTSGVLTDTCLDVVIGDEITFCQSELVRATGEDKKIVGSGDSGSPVFYDLGEGNALLGGILWAGVPSGVSLVFSPIDSVRSVLWPIEIAVDSPRSPPLPPVRCLGDEQCCEPAANGECLHCVPRYYLCPFPDLPVDFLR